jgi:hypothetical protein
MNKYNTQNNSHTRLQEAELHRQDDIERTLSNGTEDVVSL